MQENETDRFTAVYTESLQAVQFYYDKFSSSLNTLQTFSEEEKIYDSLSSKTTPQLELIEETQDRLVNLSTH